MTRGEPQPAQPLSRPSGFCSFPDTTQHTPMTQLLWPGGMWSRNKDWTWARLGNNNSNNSRRWLPWRQPELWQWPEGHVNQEKVWNHMGNTSRHQETRELSPQVYVSAIAQTGMCFPRSSVSWPGYKKRVWKMHVCGWGRVGLMWDLERWMQNGSERIGPPYHARVSGDHNNLVRLEKAERVSLPQETQAWATHTAHGIFISAEITVGQNKWILKNKKTKPKRNKEETLHFQKQIRKKDRIFTSYVET